MDKRTQLVLKRSLDLVLSFSGLILFSWIFLLIALAIKLDSRGPVFFKQARPGKNGKVFYIYKFRTMKNIRDENRKLLPDDQRLTKIGNLLRRLSLDELPELWNLMKSDMSLVGPRPLLIQYLGRYTPEQARRHDVKPGITGWAQINGRNAITWEQKFALDVWYVDHQSLWLDLKIIALTIWKILMREGINQPGQATMEEFRGEPNK